MEDSIIIGYAIAVVAIFTMGYYCGHRGFIGVETDLKNVKTDIEKIKNAIVPSSPPVPAATVVVETPRV